MSAVSLPAAPRARLAPLPPVFPFSWAVAYGEDRCGLWQAFEVGGVRQVLRWIPPGRYLMGSPANEPERSTDERQHPVVLSDGFWLADTTCTQALWAAVMDGANPSQFPGDPEHPIERVSWTDVVEGFLPRLNAALPGLDARLPTEAQWEYACRGDAEESSPFWFGGQIDASLVNFDGRIPMPGGRESEYRRRTVPVKALPANGWGLHQMHGNVWEWCSDWFAPYDENEGTNPTGPLEAPTESARRVLRGGSWFDGAGGCLSADRGALVPGGRYGSIGFRLARGPS